MSAVRGVPPGGVLTRHPLPPTSIHAHTHRTQRHRSRRLHPGEDEACREGRLCLHLGQDLHAPPHAKHIPRRTLQEYDWVRVHEGLLLHLCLAPGHDRTGASRPQDTHADPGATQLAERTDTRHAPRLWVVGRGFPELLRDPNLSPRSSRH